MDVMYAGFAGRKNQSQKWPLHLSSSLALRDIFIQAAHKPTDITESWTMHSSPDNMLTADDTAETAVRAMKLGAVDYLTKPFNTDEVKIVLNSIIEKESLRQEVTYLRKVYSESFEKNLLGESAAIKELKEKMVKMARARVSTVSFIVWAMSLSRSVDWATPFKR